MNATFNSDLTITFRSGSLQGRTIRYTAEWFSYLKNLYTVAPAKFARAAERMA